MAVVAIGSNNRVIIRNRRLHTDDNRLLPNIQVAKAANQAHAIDLSGLLFEPADQKHVPVKLLNDLF